MIVSFAGRTLYFEGKYSWGQIAVRESFENTLHSKLH